MYLDPKEPFPVPESAPVPAPAKPKRKAGPRKPKLVPENRRGRKTLVTAVTALVIAAADLFLTVRLGIKLW